jgi:hypothetical protein
MAATVEQERLVEVEGACPAKAERAPIGEQN